ncbi:MAG: hypothetical protein H0V01_03180 [Bacteroidetes bacterium]|nr:hypothetical protein [Bacteroidota bacterium]HET6245611.1 hypothetical protein [Bacteroidia bacterium]
MGNIYIKSALLICFLLIANLCKSQSNELKETSTSFIHEKSNTFQYILTGLKTPSDAGDLESIFKTRPGIYDVKVILSTHTIIIYSEQKMQETDIKEILKFAGKEIIGSEKELSKYY